MSVYSRVKVDVEIRWVRARSALVKSGIYDIDYALNPYIGCEHGCAYCYARFMTKYTGTDKEWGEFVYIKINLPRVLASEVKKITKGSILISSVTDPYQPLERKYLLTRRSLEILSKTDLQLVILTKSDLVLRDIDILTRMKNIEVGFTITTINEKISNVLEPKAPSPLRRIKALEILNREGIRTFVFIAPFIPILSESRLDSLLRKISEINVDRVVIDTLNIKYGNRQYIERAVKKLGRWNEVNKVLSNKQSFLRYYNEVKSEIKELCESLGLKTFFLF